jgi:hypothetical protein
MKNIAHHHLKLVFPGWAHPLILLFMPGVYITHKMANDPKWQFTFNAFFSVFWLIVMGIIVYLPTFRGPQNLAALLIMEVSLWANFISHYGALGANVAAMIAGQVKEIQQPETPTELRLTTVFDY